MGCYGIGLGRLMATIVEVHSDEKGIIWPEEVAPFTIHLISLESGKGVKKEAEKIYKNLKEENFEVLYDDREDKSAGEKFADCDLMGVPVRIIVSGKTLAKNCVEIKKRKEKKEKLVKISNLKKSLKDLIK